VNPLVSVVIPVNNTEKYLIKCVNSITEQSYKNIEIILVDDGSTDSSSAICDELGKTDGRITVIHKENGGLSSARNTGIGASGGRYIIFVDSDDVLDGNAVADMVEIADSEGSDAVIPMTYYKVYEKTGKTEQVFHFEEDMFSSDPKIFALNVLIGKCRASRSTAVLYSLNVIKENGLLYPKNRVSEDFFFNVDFLSAARKISLYKKPSLYNLKRKGSLSTAYHEDFFDTILEMDKKVECFLEKLDTAEYGNDIHGKRETLLFKNVLVYAVSVMGNTEQPYSARVSKCKRMFKNERFENAVKSGVGTPYFPSRFKQIFMRTAFLLVRMKLYGLTCLVTYFASKKITV